MKDLGAGSFGTCKLAIDTDGEYVAVKLIPRGRRVRMLDAVRMTDSVRMDAPQQVLRLRICTVNFVRFMV